MDIAIVGASGYAGGDLIRLLLTHPQANIVCAPPVNSPEHL